MILMHQSIIYQYVKTTQLEISESRPNSSMSTSHQTRPGSDMNTLAIVPPTQSSKDSGDKVPRPASTNPQQKGNNRRLSHENHQNNKNYNASNAANSVLTQGMCALKIAGTKF